MREFMGLSLLFLRFPLAIPTPGGVDVDMRRAAVFGNHHKAIAAMQPARGDRIHTRRSVIGTGEAWSTGGYMPSPASAFRNMIWDV